MSKFNKINQTNKNLILHLGILFLFGLSCTLQKSKIKKNRHHQESHSYSEEEIKEKFDLNDRELENVLTASTHSSSSWPYKQNQSQDPVSSLSDKYTTNLPKNVSAAKNPIVTKVETETKIKNKKENSLSLDVIKDVKQGDKVVIAPNQGRDQSSLVSINYPSYVTEPLKKLDQVSAPYFQQLKNKSLEDHVESIYDLVFMGTTAGSFVIKKPVQKKLGSKNVWHVQIAIKSSKFYSYVYKVEDLFESYIDLETFTPLKYHVSQNESAQEVDDLQLFDKEKFKIYYFHKRKTKDDEIKKKQKEEIIPHYYVDALSLLYFIRAIDIKPNEFVNFPMVSSAKLMELSLNLDGVELMETPLGRKKCFRYMVRVKKAQDFEKYKKLKFVFWLEDNKNKDLIKLEIDTKMGSLTGTIKDQKVFP